MITATLDTPSARPSRRRRNPGLSTQKRTLVNRLGRIMIALALTGAAAWLLLNTELVRAGEAHLASLWMNLWVDRGVTADNDTYILWIAENHLVAFQVTVECTAVILIAPLLVFGAALMLSLRIRWIRGLSGIASMLAITLVVNQLRLALIGWSTQQWGLEAGYEFSHRFAGSAIGILGFAGGLVVMLVVMGLRRPHIR